MWRWKRAPDENHWPEQVMLKSAEWIQSECSFRETLRRRKVLVSFVQSETAKTQNGPSGWCHHISAAVTSSADITALTVTEDPPWTTSHWQTVITDLRPALWSLEAHRVNLHPGRLLETFRSLVLFLIAPQEQWRSAGVKECRPVDSKTHSYES